MSGGRKTEKTGMQMLMDADGNGTRRQAVGAPLRTSITDLTMLIESIRQEGAVGGFEADGFGKGLGVEFDDDDVIAGGDISGLVFDRLGIDPDGTAIGTGELE